MKSRNNSISSAERNAKIIKPNTFFSFLLVSFDGEIVSVDQLFIYFTIFNLIMIECFANGLTKAEWFVFYNFFNQQSI